MPSPPLAISNFPRAILHIDGDAFFASCEQSRDPKLKGKPVVTGKERGIAASMSYEAKARGVTRGMRLSEIKKVCPDAILLPSDYETYSLLSKRLYSIVRRWTPDVEEYGIDECFADLTGLRRVNHASYETIAENIKKELDNELGFTFSVGLAPNKVIAKVASKWKKPSGLTIIPGKSIHLYLEKIPVEKIWGIGPQTTAYLNKFDIKTALEFARREEAWTKQNLSKPFYEIWQELNGKFILPLNTEEKESYQSIQKFKTFTPPTSDRAFVFAQLSKNIENACIKARRYKLSAKSVVIILRTQDFRHAGMEIKLSSPTSFPNEIIKLAEKPFDKIFNRRQLYRATGVCLLKLEEFQNAQLDLFGRALEIEKMDRLFQSVDKIKTKYGKHTLYLGSSHLAHKFSAHLGDRGDKPRRESLKSNFKGSRSLTSIREESPRKRLGIPMFLGEVK